MLSDKKIDKYDILRRYKTSSRSFLDNEREILRKQYSVYDVIFANQEAEVTEASYHSIFLRFGAFYHTPELESGLLNGVGRMLFIENHASSVIERRIKIDDLEKADEILLVSSIRGVNKVGLLRP